MKKRLAAALLALGLAAGPVGTVSADAPDGHNGHGVPAMELRLNNGQKWQTDEVLRAGMSQIREVMDASLPPIHSGRYSAADLSALGDWVQEQVDVVVANCKLPEEADLQLHVALTQILDGVNTMKEEGRQELGAAAIVQALNAYGEHFDHPGWKPLEH
jgi:hypothetical protein